MMEFFKKQQIAAQEWSAKQRPVITSAIQSAMVSSQQTRLLVLLGSLIIIQVIRIYITLAYTESSFDSMSHLDNSTIDFLHGRPDYQRKASFTRQEQIPIKKFGDYSPPTKCSNRQLERVMQQLPPDDCIQYKKNPWLQNCSFCKATRCHDPLWLKDFYAQRNPISESFLSVFVGCNKADDAVNALRLGSRNPNHNVIQWLEKLANGRKEDFAGSSCAHFDEKGQVALNGKEEIRPAQVYCFEPIPVTFAELNRTKLELNYGDELVLEQAALAAQPGVLKVKAVQPLGVENRGIDRMASDCTKGGKGCQDVPIYTLDSYSERMFPTRSIHYLSIDVEGFDYYVIQGAQNMLNRVHYLEFEYNWVGPWADFHLADVIALLKSHSFTCYWAGHNGYIWRITDCWLDHYDLHYWSNIACVNFNIKEAHPLAQRMESMFLATLENSEAMY